MEFEIFWFIVGIVLLVKFSDFAIQHTVKLSHKTGISTMALGFVLIAVATSLPELAIAITSSVRGEGLLSFGNLVGANVINLTLIFGLMSLFGLKLTEREAGKSMTAVIAAALLGFMVLILGGVDLAFGIFLIILFYAFSRTVMREGVEPRKAVKNEKVHGLLSRYLLYILVSVAVVALSAQVVTDTAIIIAQHLGVAESLIGATILAIGTTLPELSVSLAAIRRRDIDLAVGNAVGSVITNIMLVLGVAAIISPIRIGLVSTSALVAMIAVCMAFLYFASRRIFRPIDGIILWSIFVFYVMAMVMIAAL